MNFPATLYCFAPKTGIRPNFSIDCFYNMSTEDLTQRLKQLQDELINTQKLDENSVRLLQGVLNDIQLAIERSANGSGNSADLEVEDVAAKEESNSIGAKLRGLIDAFEVEHPRLTMSLSQLAEYLAEIGI